MISVVIINYNNDKYVRSCIESVLPYKKEGIEIIVVDDGSTDDSRRIISEYEGELKAVHKTNGGQMSAYAAGLRESRFGWLLYLDGDDCLAAHSFSKVFEHLQDGVSKVQYNLSIIDSSGAAREGKVPSMMMGLVDEIESLELFGEYASPPASGAIYSRTYLEQIVPTLEKIFKLPVYADAPLYLLAPSFGKVVSINEVCGLYRKHSAGACGWSDNNDTSNLMSHIRKQYFREKHAVGERNRVCMDLSQQLDLGLRIGKPRTLNEIKVVAFLAGTYGARGFRKTICWLIHCSVFCPGYPSKIRLKAIVWSLLFAFPFGRRYRLSLGSLLFR